MEGVSKGQSGQPAKKWSRLSDFLQHTVRSSKCTVNYNPLFVLVTIITKMEIMRNLKSHQKRKWGAIFQLGHPFWSQSNSNSLTLERLPFTSCCITSTGSEEEKSFGFTCTSILSNIKKCKNNPTDANPGNIEQKVPEKWVQMSSNLTDSTNFGRSLLYLWTVHTVYQVKDSLKCRIS